MIITSRILITFSLLLSKIITWIDCAACSDDVPCHQDFFFFFLETYPNITYIIYLCTDNVHIKLTILCGLIWIYHFYYVIISLYYFFQTDNLTNSDANLAPTSMRCLFRKISLLNAHTPWHPLFDKHVLFHESLSLQIL